MGYYFYDVDGYLADGPSTQGLEELKEAISGPAIDELFELGATERLADLELELEIEMAVSVQDPPSVQSDIQALHNTAVRASGVLILTDGVGHETEE